MPGSDSYAPFDVVVVPFPYSDRLAEKRRPALMVSSGELTKLGLVWVVMITSASNRSRDDDVPIADLRLAGLQVASVVRPAKLATIEPNRIVRRAGGLDEATAKRVAQVMTKYLARPR
jgi:mRNA interferase MazF